MYMCRKVYQYMYVYICMYICTEMCMYIGIYDYVDYAMLCYAMLD